MDSQPLRALLASPREGDLRLLSEALSRLASRPSRGGEWRIEWARSYEQGLGAALGTVPSAVFVDSHLPTPGDIQQGGGVAFCRAVIERGCTVPLFVLADEDEDKAPIGVEFLARSELSRALIERAIRYFHEARRARKWSARPRRARRPCSRPRSTGS